jgi:hypothetical protein
VFVRRLLGVGSLLLVLACLSPFTRTAAAGEVVSFGAYDVRSMFYVAKSENQNQVHYAIRLDADCKPLKKQPVFAYWKRLRKGVRYDEPLLPPGTRLYGASDDQQVQLAKLGGQVKMYVKALKRLPIDISVAKVNGTCKATSIVTIKGEPAQLRYAYLQLGRLGLTVKYVDVIGYRLRDGAKVVQQFE